MKKRIDKKAFTLIELLVVIAVIGILVLLGAPRFTGYTQKAELTRIQHDIKVMEQEVGTVLSTNDDFNKWENNNKDLNQLAQDNELFEKEGPVAQDGEPIDRSYKVIPEEYKDKINTKLKGTFYANIGGKVYYEHGKGPGYSDEEIDNLVKKHGFIPVATADELNNVRYERIETYGKGTKWEGKYTGGLLRKKYVQVANIDLSEYSEEGWTPIGDTSAEEFRGIYDGGNYVIKGLEVKGEGKNYQGLFARTREATIRNVGLIDNKVTGSSDVGGLVGYASSSTIENSYATGPVTGTGYAGGLVGMAYYSTIRNSYATGSVESGSERVGGLVGSASTIIIENSYATGSVTGNRLVGGLVGWAYGSTTIEKSYATGKVTGAENVGGLVGRSQNNTIENSYATGAVEGASNVGGLVGQAYGSNTTIEKSYATGKVTGGTSTGGLVGTIGYGTTETNSYWDKETTGQEQSAGGGVGKSTKEMKNKDTYSGWDFDNVWNIVNGEYPKLR